MNPQTGTAGAPHGAALAVLVAALEAVTVPPAGLPALRAAPQASLERFPLAGLGLDSLGRMEFCIQLELDHGVPLTPDRLVAMAELGELLRFIASAGAPPPP
jgi:hypothetical protein